MIHTIISEQQLEKDTKIKKKKKVKVRFEITEKKGNKITKKTQIMLKLIVGITTGHCLYE